MGGHSLSISLRIWAQLHAHRCTHKHNSHKWHSTRLAAPHKCPTHATVGSITVNSRPLKKPWQCIYWMPQVRVLWAVLEAQLYTGVCSWDQNGRISLTVKQKMCSHWQAMCSHMMAFHTALCMWTNGVQSTPHMWYCRSSLRQRANWSWWAFM